MQESSTGPRRSWPVTSGERSPGAVGQLLRLLPDWFGVESAIADYVAAARDLPTYLAWPGDRPAPPAGRPGDQPEDRQPVGVLLAARHFPCSAEIYLLAVHPDLHRSGVGRALVTALETDLVADGVQFLQVKTLGPAHPDPGYDRTRKFYAGVGFWPLEETRDLWPDNPCLIMIKSLR